jgi:hypothetical protein
MKHFTLPSLCGTLLLIMVMFVVPSTIQAKASPRMMEEITQDSLIKLKQDTLRTLISDANALLSSGISAAISAELADDPTLYEDLASEDSTPSLDDLNAAIEKMRKDITTVKNAAVYYNKFAAAVTELSQLETQYPALVASGSAALEKEYERLTDSLQSSTCTIAIYIQGYKDAKAAKMAYLLSGGYSAENPADLTCLITYPNLRTATTEATDSTGFGDWGANQGIYKADTLQGGWSFTTKPVGNRYMRGLVCLQFWAWNGASIDLQQTLSDLPDGLYTVSALFNTCNGRENDQHSYAKSGGVTAVSPNLLADGLWPDTESDDNIVAGDWTKLTTDKIMVTDGTLTIGAASKVAQIGNYGDAGWFCVGDFHLSYYGNDSSLLEKDLKDKQDAATVMADTMKLKGDKSALIAAIEASKNSSLTNSEALTVLNSGISEANVSIREFSNFNLITIPEYVADVDTTVSDNKAMVNTVIAYIKITMASDTATYKMLTGMESILSSYVDQINLIADASSNYTKYSSSKYYTDFITELNAEITAMKASVQSVETIATYKATIKKFLADMQLENSIANPGPNCDVSFLITNPTTYGTDNSVAPEGWTINKGVGNVYFDWKNLNAEESSRPVFLTWNGTAGSILWNATQTINYVPNGTYRLEALFGGTDAYNETTMGTGVCLTAETTAGGLRVKEHTVKYVRDYMKEFFPSLYNESDNTISNGEIYGGVWESSVQAYLSGTYTKADSLNIFGGTAIDAGTENPNDICQGYGWYKETIDNIIVTDNKITIGCSTDSTKTGYKYNGTWFEITNFALYYVAVSDGIQNIQSENTPISAYAENGKIIVKSNKPYNVYSITGAIVNKNATLAKGVYIVHSGNQTKKIMVK